MRFVASSAALVLLLADLTAAVPWLDPVETPMGVMAAVGFSPVPTEAPGLGSIPKELLRKQNSVPYPPPVECTSGRPYCGTYAFDAGTRLYNCESTTGATQSVQFLADYYLTAIGSQIGSSIYAPIIITAPSQIIPSSRYSYTRGVTVSGTAINNIGGSTRSPTSSAVSSSSKSGISTGAIIGIVVGVVIVILALIVALLIWYCMRRRRRQRTEVPQPPQMQEQLHQPPQPLQGPTYPPQQPIYPPQQPTYPPQQQNYPPPQQSYFHPTEPSKPTFNNNTSTLPIPEADSNGVIYTDTKPDHGIGNGPPRYSVANVSQTPLAHSSSHPHLPTPLSPLSDVSGDHYNPPPHSPTATEVEGSGLYGPGQGHGQGNPHAGISPLTTGGTAPGPGYVQGGYGPVQGGYGPGQGQEPIHGQGGYVPGPAPAQAQAPGNVYEIGDGDRRR
ncbi:hypothetical protein MMC16_002341 [Acarospora aff. strigata]|nr:hypothetical protein [Acarospora aff. strigata]